MRLMLILLLIFTGAIAQVNDCYQPQAINIEKLKEQRLNDSELFFEVQCDSIIDHFTLNLPCESWSIHKQTINCEKPHGQVFDIEGRFVLTQHQMESGICFCKSCSKAARTLHNDSNKYFISGKNCLGFPQIKSSNKIDESKPSWLQTPLKSGQKFNLNNLIFYPNKPKFIKSSLTELNHLFVLLKTNPSLIIVIQGHVNGPQQKNSLEFQKLSENRAKAVYSFLLKKGIEAKRLSHIGFGNTKMLYPKPKNEREMKKNRRVEIVIK